MRFDADVAGREGQEPRAHHRERLAAVPRAGARGGERRRRDKEAGLTHGGFYKHFDSKHALVESAIADAFADFVRMLEEGTALPAAEAFRALYLSEDHRGHPGRGCPVAALGQDVDRGSARLKAAFGAGVRRLVGALAHGRAGSAPAKRSAAIREFSMLVGAMVIARASDDGTAQEVLAACGSERRSSVSG